MESIAARMRSRDRQIVAAMSVQERIDLAHRLGDEDVEVFRQSQGISASEAIARLRRQRQRGRRPCSFFEDASE
jgi:uncharacterized protein YoaH (UPF0181 family)